MLFSTPESFVVGNQNHQRKRKQSETWTSDCSYSIMEITPIVNIQDNHGLTDGDTP